MADYNTITKVIINDISPAASDVAGSLAKEINDYIQTLDSTDRSRVAYIILYT